MFKHIPFLRELLPKVDDVLKEFKDYKSNVPTYGAIILDKELRHCLMVQGFYSRNSWGFPKGKVNQKESPMVCAIREVKEETSFDCTPYINEQDYIKKMFHGTDIKLYIVAGVDFNQDFKPATMGEIKKIDWFVIDDLPDSFTEKPTGNMSKYSFFMAIPFIRDLRKWISRRRKQQENVMPANTSFNTSLNHSIFASPAPSRVNHKVTASTPKILTPATRAVKSTPACKRISILDKLDLNARQPGDFSFSTRHWDNVHLQLDWKLIWSEVDKELLELKRLALQSRI